MKKQIIFAATILVCCFSQIKISATTTALLLKLRPGKDAQTLIVQLANLQKQNTQVLVEDVHGNILFNEKICKQDGYIKQLSIAELPVGNYTCTVYQKNGLYNKHFSITTKGLVLNELGIVENRNKMQHSPDEQEMALETCISELGLPTMQMTETNRFNAVYTFVTDTDQFSAEEIAAMQVSLSDENMALRRKELVLLLKGA